LKEDLTCAKSNGAILPRPPNPQRLHLRASSGGIHVEHLRGAGFTGDFPTHGFQDGRQSWRAQYSVSLQIKNPLQRLIDFPRRFSIQLAANFYKPV
jgi:hypothetical protein